jgi:hypothetical protein
MSAFRGNRKTFAQIEFFRVLTQLGQCSEFHAPRFRGFARERELTKLIMVCLFLGVDVVPFYIEGGSDAHSGLGDFRDALNGASDGPDVRSGLSGLPARVQRGGQLLRMQLHVAASV